MLSSVIPPMLVVLLLESILEDQLEMKIHWTILVVA
jgi:hypothetical protein